MQIGNLTLREINKLIFFLTLVTIASSILFIFSFPYVIAYRNTVYAPGFDTDTFKRIEVGMDEKTVTDMLGEPVTISSHGDERVFFYSDKKESTHYFQHTLITQDSRVIEKIDGLYFD